MRNSLKNIIVLILIFGFIFSFASCTTNSNTADEYNPATDWTYIQKLEAVPDALAGTWESKEDIHQSHFSASICDGTITIWHTSQNNSEIYWVGTCDILDENTAWESERLSDSKMTLDNNFLMISYRDGRLLWHYTDGEGTIISVRMDKISDDILFPELQQTNTLDDEIDNEQSGENTVNLQSEDNPDFDNNSEVVFNNISNDSHQDNLDVLSDSKQNITTDDTADDSTLLVDSQPDINTDDTVGSISENNITGQINSTNTSDVYNNGVTSSASSTSISEAPTSKYIDLLFVVGQSNAAGLTDQPSGYGTARAQSVACDSNMIYSSFIPLDNCGASITGITNIGSYVNKNDVNKYISKSVGSVTSLAGSELTYKPNALSTSGAGKTGMDSAIAYEWNRLTGRKVWIINISYSGSAISSWVPGTTNYEVTAEALRDVINVVNNDSNYQVGRIRMFWLQGESDTFTNQNTYESNFKTIINGWSSVTDNLKVGIIIPRAMGGDSKPFDNNNAANALRNVASAYGNVDIVCETHLQWVDDNAVANYFKSAYPNGINYPTHSGLPINVPTTYSETYVHPHYTQVAHNENGFISARNMYYIFG